MQIMGIVFNDELYGHDYKTNNNFVTPEEVLYAIRDRLAEALK